MVHTPPPRPVSPLLPILAALAGLAAFSVMDGLMKAASIALGAYTAIFWRNLMGSVLMAPLYLARRKGRPDRRALRLHVTRGVTVAGMSILFFYGLVRTPMAEAMALSFIAPLIALYLAAVLLGERIAPAAIAGSLLGLAGVAVIAFGKFSDGRPPSGEALLGIAAVLASAVLYGWNLVLQRQQAQLAGPEEIAFVQPLVVCIALAPGAWFVASTPDIRMSLALLLSAALAGFSLLMLSWAYARAEAQVLVPMEYTGFIWAALTGWLAFGEPVTAATLGGVVLIVAGCLIAAPRKAAPVQDSSACSSP